MQGTIAAAILAGGRGQRLGGVDKALVPLAGQPLLAHVLARLRPQTGHIVLSANGDARRFAAFGLPVVADSVPGRGPLGGIAAAAADCRRRWPQVRWLATVPVDTPLVPPDLVERLAAAALDHGAAPAGQPARRVVVAEAGGRRHWTVALWPLEAAAGLSEQMERDGLRRVEDAVALTGWRSVSFPDAAAFANVNRADDLDEVDRLLREF